MIEQDVSKRHDVHSYAWHVLEAKKKKEEDERRAVYTSGLRRLQMLVLFCSILDNNLIYLDLSNVRNSYNIKHLINTLLYKFVHVMV